MTGLALAFVGLLAAADPTLGDPSYRFCHDPTYELTPDEHAWCPLVPTPSDACPSLPEACARPPTARGGRFGLRTGSSPPAGPKSSDEKSPTSKPGPRDDASHRDPGSTKDPEAPKSRDDAASIAAPVMSGFARLLFFALIGVFVIGLARAIAKNFVREDEPEPTDAGPEPVDPERVPAAERGPIETDVERLLNRARVAAMRGDYRHALDDVYAALLRRLDGDGLIDIHASRTNGDYLRQLRERPELVTPIREVFREVERVQFGKADPTARAYESVLARVAPLVGRALAVALFCGGLSGLVSCRGPLAASDTGHRGDASPSGRQGIVDTLRAAKVTARLRVHRLREVEGPLALVVLPGAELDHEAVAHLLAWAEGKGSCLIFAGVAPKELGVSFDAATPGPAELSYVGPNEHAFGLSARIPVAPRARVPLDAEPPFAPVLSQDGVPYAVMRAAGEGRIVVLGTDALFTNISLALPGNAAFTTRLLAELAPGREVELADEWTGAGAETPLESVRRAELTPVVLQLLVLFALFLLWKGIPFARLRDPAEQRRRAFADHARALGVAYARARASHHVAGLYARWALDRLRERVHRAGRQGLIPLAEAIAARTGRTEADVMSVLVDASGARDEASPASIQHSSRAPVPPSPRAGGEDLALMRDLEGFLAATGQPRGAVNRKKRRAATPQP